MHAENGVASLQREDADGPRVRAAHVPIATAWGVAGIDLRLDRVIDIVLLGSIGEGRADRRAGNPSGAANGRSITEPHLVIADERTIRRPVSRRRPDRCGCSCDGWGGHEADIPEEAVCTGTRAS